MQQSPEPQIKKPQGLETQLKQLQLFQNLKIKQQIQQIILTADQYLICAAPTSIIIYSLFNQQPIRFKVDTMDYFIVQFPPYIFGCIMYQNIYLFTKQSIKDFTKIVTMKISRLIIKSLCSFNNGYFMGGYNKKNILGEYKNRTIYYLQNLTFKQKNKPLFQIPIPKNQNAITILQIQHPYLLCYCAPSTHIINHKNKQILITFQKQFLSLSMLSGRYSYNCVNLIGISIKSKAIITVDVQKYPTFGVQLNQYQEKATSVCQQKQGIIYCSYKNQIYMYNLSKKQKSIVRSYPKDIQVIKLRCSLTNKLVVLLSHKPIPNGYNENGINSNIEQKYNISQQLSQIQDKHNLSRSKRLGLSSWYFVQIFKINH